MLRPIRYFSILRNEINSRQTAQIARGWQREGGGFSATADRAQRHTLALRDVAYIIRARPMVREGVQEDPAKYRDQFRRRVKDGRCFATPYLGCREFSAWFSDTGGQRGTAGNQRGPGEYAAAHGLPSGRFGERRPPVLPGRTEGRCSEGSQRHRQRRREMLLKKLAEYSERLETAAQPVQRRTGPVLGKPGPGPGGISHRSATARTQSSPRTRLGTAPPPAPGAESGWHSPASAG